MKIAVVPGDDSGCGRYRLKWPAEAVRKVRPDWQIDVYRPKGDIQVGMNQKGQVVQVDMDPPDVMVLQRTGTPVLSGVAEYMMAQGTAVVVDFDDAMWCIDRKNLAWSTWNLNPHRGKKQHWSWCDYTAERVDLVTVTTDGLAKRYGRKHGRVEVLPNGVPQEALEAPSWRERYDPAFTVGWSGYTATHPGDPLESAPAVELVRERGGKARVVADGDGVRKLWGQPVDAVSNQPLGQKYYSSMSVMDLMLVGLKDSPFNHCKSYLKVLEAASAGTPAVASATQPHRTLKKSGFPVTLVDGRSEWKKEVARLMNDPGYYKEQVEAVRHHIPFRTIEHRAEEWAKAWERARSIADRRG